MDSVVEVTGGERGFIMLWDDEAGELVYSTGRNLSPSGRQAPEFSRNIVQSDADAAPTDSWNRSDVNAPRGQLLRVLNESEGSSRRRRHRSGWAIHDGSRSSCAASNRSATRRCLRSAGADVVTLPRGPEVEVLEGLQPGDRVLVHPSDRVDDGARRSWSDCSAEPQSSAVTAVGR